MKKVLSLIAITATVAMVMTACKNGKTSTAAVNQDTVGLAEYQAWKLQQQAPVQTRTVTKYVSSNNGSMSSSSSHQAQTSQKRGWSKAAKGAVIGGAGGAVVGAVVNKKNRVAGGVIGGIIGGAAGYGIGRSQDKKDGRY